MKIGVFGAGTWAMALARMLCNSGHEVTVWSAIPEELTILAETRRHKNLPGAVLPEAIRCTAEMERGRHRRICRKLSRRCRKHMSWRRLRAHSALMSRKTVSFGMVKVSEAGADVGDRKRLP